MSGRRETPDGAGIGRSYGELYVEYAPAARGLALSMVPPDVADDIVAEAFARVLAAIRAGGGPDHEEEGLPRLVNIDFRGPHHTALTPPGLTAHAHIVYPLWHDATSLERIRRSQSASRSR